MATNVAVEKLGNESNTNLLRRFSKRVQGSGVLMRVRSMRYRSRAESKYKRKVRALKILKRREEVMEQIKLGKLQPKK